VALWIKERLPHFKNAKRRANERVWPLVKYEYIITRYFLQSTDMTKLTPCAYEQTRGFSHSWRVSLLEQNIWCGRRTPLPRYCEINHVYPVAHNAALVYETRNLHFIVRHRSDPGANKERHCSVSTSTSIRNFLLQILQMLTADSLVDKPRCLQWVSRCICNWIQ
jgi:hypothetical protein